MPKEEVYRYRAEIDHGSLRQQVDQLRAAVGVSMQLQSPDIYQNISGVVGAGQLGYNTLLNDLQQSTRYAYSAIPQFNTYGSGSLFGMSLSGAILGSAGIGAPSNFYASDYAKIARGDLARRVSETAANVPLSAVKFAANWGPSIAAGAGALASGMGAVDAAYYGWLGAFSLGLPWGIGITAGMAAVGHSAEQVGQQIGSQFRYENMLSAASYGQLSGYKKSIMARRMRRAVASIADIDLQGGAEVFAYATQAGLLKANQDVNEFDKNFKSLLEATRTIMKTFHKSIQESVAMMSEMKAAGIFRPDQFSSNAMLIKARSEIAGISSQAMFGLQTMGAQVSRGVLNAPAGRELSTKMASYVGEMVRGGLISEQRAYELTGTTGAGAILKMAQNTTSQMVSMLKSNDMGARLMMGLITPQGEINRDLLTKLKSGSRTAISEILENQAALASKLGGDVSTIRGLSRDALKKLSSNDMIDVVIGLVRAKAYDIGKDPDNLSTYQTKDILRSYGWTDESSLEMMTHLYKHPALIRNVKKQQAANVLRKAIKDNKDRYTFTNRAYEYIDEIYTSAASPFIDIRDRATSAYLSLHDTIFGSDAEYFKSTESIEKGILSNISETEIAYEGSVERAIEGSFDKYLGLGKKYFGFESEWLPANIIEKYSEKSAYTKLMKESPDKLLMLYKKYKAPMLRKKKYRDQLKEELLNLTQSEGLATTLYDTFMDKTKRLPMMNIARESAIKSTMLAAKEAAKTILDFNDREIMRSQDVPLSLKAAISDLSEGAVSMEEIRRFHKAAKLVEGKDINNELLTGLIDTIEKALGSTPETRSKDASVINVIETVPRKLDQMQSTLVDILNKIR